MTRRARAASRFTRRPTRAGRPASTTARSNPRLAACCSRCTITTRASGEESVPVFGEGGAAGAGWGYAAVPCHPHPAARCARVHPPRRRGGIPGVPRSGFCFVFFATLAGLVGVAAFAFFVDFVVDIGFALDIRFVVDVSLAVLANGLQELKVLDSFEDVALRPVVAVDGKLDLAAQDGLEGRHRDHATVLLYGDGAISH